MIRRLKDTWMGFARLLAVVNGAILLTILFFCIITPLGFLMRLMRKSPLASTPQSASQWVPFPVGDDPRKPF